MKKNSSDSKTKKHSPFSLLAKGALFGLANIIPGVSGGTMAVITGVYDDFMKAISHFIREWRFLVLYLSGAVLGIAGGSVTIQKLFEHWPGPTLFCFMGFILGGLPFLVKKADLRGKKIRRTWVPGFVLAFALVLLMAFVLQPAEREAITEFTLPTALILAGGAILASSAMVIPGISGSFLLLLAGLYTTFISAVTRLDIPMLICIAAGVGLGILLTAKIISFFLARFYHATYGVILGLVCASVIALWPGLPRGMMIFYSLAAFALGLAGGAFLGDRDETANNETADSRGKTERKSGESPS